MLILYSMLQAIADNHTCSFASSALKTVVQFETDKHADMFQIGRSAEPPIDFVVMDTVPGAEFVSDSFVTRSTISRFACRILVDRCPPHSISLFAAGFDTKKRIQLGVS